MEGKDRKSLNVKVVLLKQMPHNRSYYQTYEIKDELGRKVSFHEKNKANPKNTSIAYLSSIIQDDKLMDEENQMSFAQAYQNSDQALFDKRYSANIQQQSKLFKLMRNKQNSRELSSLVQNSEKKNKIYKSKTQGIDKIIEERKLMPINRLKIRTKNIKFSSKNKQELCRDFNQFVISKNKEAYDIKENSQSANIMYNKRRSEHQQQKKSKSWLNSMRAQLKYHANQSQQKRSSQIKMSPKKVRYQEQHRYATYLKRLKSSIPQVDHFGWTKLNKDLFKLQSH